MLIESFPLLSRKCFLLCILYSSLCTSAVHTQTCSPIQDFEANAYNTSHATYTWLPASDASYYEIESRINAATYYRGKLTASATSFVLDFQPPLQHNDVVETTLTKHCLNGGNSSATFEFIIVTDAVVYLTGGPQQSGKIRVEPVHILNDNLIPGANVCGVCDPSYFRVTAGFYGPYSIAMDPGLTTPIEQFRFLKSDLCNCLNDAVSLGILAPSGGAGPNYIPGQPFKCNMTLYLFNEIDCSRSGGGKAERSTPIQENSFEISPNPMQGQATITTEVAEPLQGVSLSLYGSSGQLVMSLFTGNYENAGVHRVSFDTAGLLPGVYQCRFQSENFVKTRSVVVLR